MRWTFAPLVLAAACGDDVGTTIDASGDAAETDATVADAGIDAIAIDAGIDAAGPLMLTSSVVVEGGVLPVRHACHGADVSPPLTWSGGPQAASYAMIFTDITNASPFIHSIIWDIPGNVTALPEDIEKVAEPTEVPGSKQAIGFDGVTRGYLGPCPSNMHRYEFALYALDVSPLPGVTLQSSRNNLRNAIFLHDTAVATLRVTYTPP
jgi:hypothetical protein